MDLELRCPSCKDYYRSPVYLPCSHSLCYTCALTTIQQSSTIDPHRSTFDISSTSFASDLDKLSLTSDNDSGVIINRHSTSSASSSSSSSSSISSSSRPSSLLLPPALPEISSSSFLSTTPTHRPSPSHHHHHQSTNKTYSTCLQCPVCSKLIYMDTSGVKSLPQNRLLAGIVARFHNETIVEQQQQQQLTPKCQLCRSSEERSITRICEQCRIGYCDQCREQYHPMRGPYAKHQFLDATHQIPDQQQSHCPDHSNRFANWYCLHCRSECCQQCSTHKNHDTVPLNQAAKAYKTQLSSQLQCLSEKAKCGAEFLAKLKLYPDYIKKNGEIFQKNLVKEIDNLVLALESKKRELLNYIDEEIQRKITLIQQQCVSYNGHIQRTTGFLQFSVEALKESDPLTYLQVCHGLNGKSSHLFGSFSDEFEPKPHTSYEFDLTFNSECLSREIHRLQFQQMKAPSSPRFIAEQCVCHDDDESSTTSGTLAWSTRDAGAIQGFILELDDGTFGSDFREVYDGTETMCAVDGLAPACVYSARVKAYNQAGESAYSECITLHSSSVDWFTFNPRTAHPDIQFLSGPSQSDAGSIGFHSITCQSSQERVALGSRGYRTGVHYWEVTIQRYDDKPDPAFGVARFDVSKENMLGKDAKSWCMYIDSQRSWFMHNGQHTNRVNGGIAVGSIIGVLLDLNNGTLSFFVNDEPHGPLAFTNLTQGGIYYPAISLNKNVHLTLVSGLDPPQSMAEV